MRCRALLIVRIAVSLGRLISQPTQIDQVIVDGLNFGRREKTTEIAHAAIHASSFQENIRELAVCFRAHLAKVGDAAIRQCLRGT